MAAVATVGLKPFSSHAAVSAFGLCHSQPSITSDLAGQASPVLFYGIQNWRQFGQAAEARSPMPASQARD
eukprot:11463261-Karenia_brevis.AAC.1